MFCGGYSCHTNKTIIMLGKYSDQTKDNYCFCSLGVVAQLDSHIEFK